MATAASRYDLARFGAEVMRFSPRQCDLLIVAGRVVMKMLPVLQRIWLQMPEPKWCISMGACACSGGVFDSYAVVQGVDRFISVDMYVPGCPPRPEQLLAAVIDMQEKIRATGTVMGKEFLARTTPTGPSPFDPDELLRIKDGSLIQLGGFARSGSAEGLKMVELQQLTERLGVFLTESTFRDNRRVDVPAGMFFPC